MLLPRLGPSQHFRQDVLGPNIGFGSVTIRSLTHFILASGLSSTVYDWTVVTLDESSTLRSISTPYESRYPPRLLMSHVILDSHTMTHPLCI